MEHAILSTFPRESQIGVEGWKEGDLADFTWGVEGEGAWALAWPLFHTPVCQLVIEE